MIGRFRVSLDFAQAGVARNRGDLVHCASSFSKPPRSGLAQSRVPSSELGQLHCNDHGRIHIRPGDHEEALGHGVDGCALIVAAASLLPGKVICPDDPAIPLVAKGYAGRTVAFEADAVHWDTGRTIEVLLKEIDSADYVITMGRRHGWLSDEALLTSGFVKSGFRTTSTPE